MTHSSTTHPSTTSPSTTPSPGSGDVDHSEIIEDGMQGADGSTNADGLDPGADPQDTLQALRENLGDLAQEDRTD